MDNKNVRAGLQKRLDRLKEQHAELMRGRLVPSLRAQIVQRKILDIQNEIKALDREAADRLALGKIPIDNALEVIAIPLLADVIIDLVAGVDSTLRKHGVQETVFGIYTARIRQAAMAMVDTLAASEEGLPKLLEVDDTLVDAVKKKLMSYVKRRLKIKP